MDDWEQHFVDKSRRRFEVERRMRRRRGIRIFIAGALIALVALAAITEFANQQ